VSFGKSERQEEIAHSSQFKPELRMPKHQDKADQQNGELDAMVAYGDRWNRGAAVGGGSNMLVQNEGGQGRSSQQQKPPSYNTIDNSRSTLRNDPAPDFLRQRPIGTSALKCRTQLSKI